MADQRFELAPGTLLYVVAPTGEMTALRVGAAGGELVLLEADFWSVGRSAELRLGVRPGPRALRAPAGP